MQRHPKLSLRSSDSLSRVRSNAVTDENMVPQRDFGGEVFVGQALAHLQYGRVWHATRSRPKE